MEENKEMLELLKQIEKSNRQQARLGKLMCAGLLVMTLCLGAGVWMFWNLVPQVESVIPQAHTVISQMQTVLSNLEEASAQLAQADLSGMVSNVDTLVATGQESLEQTMAKLDTIDFETLNAAIEDLAAVVEPMSRLANMFR